MTMETFTIIDKDTNEELVFVQLPIEGGHTIMEKNVYDAIQAEQSTPIVTADE